MGRRPKSIVALALVLSLTLMTLSCSSHHEVKPPPPGANAGPNGHPVPLQGTSQAVEQGRCAGGQAVRAPGHGQPRHRQAAGDQLPGLRIRAHQGDEFGRLDQGRQHVPGADVASRAGPAVDRPLRQRLTGPDDPGLLRSRRTPRQGGQVPIYPPALASAPLNLHTHGLHVEPVWKRGQRSSQHSRRAGQHL